MLAAALVVLGALVLWRIEAVLRAMVAKHDERADRVIAVQERLAAAEEAKAAPKPAPRSPGMPPDLAGWAESESMPWAREQVARAYAEQFEHTGDWEEVKRQYMLGTVS